MIPPRLVRPLSSPDGACVKRVIILFFYSSILILKEVVTVAENSLKTFSSLVSYKQKDFTSCPCQVFLPTSRHPPGARSSQQQCERRQQHQCQSSPAGGSKGRGAVAQVGVAADVGVVEVEAGGVLLPAHTALRGDGAALLVHRYL